MSHTFEPYDDGGDNYDDHIIIKHVMEPLTQSIAAVSLLCCSTIIVTAITFPIMLRKKPFMQMFLIIAIIDFVSSIFLLFGYAHGTECVIQGAIFTFTQRAIFFWLTALTYQLYDVTMNGKLHFSMTFLHITIWSLSLFLELIILISDNYGVNSKSQGLQICLLQNSNGFKYSIFIILFVPLLLCVTIILYLLFKITTRYITSMHIKVLVLTFWRYPLVLITLWLPYFICFIIFISGGEKVKHLYTGYDFSLAIIPFFGIYQSITFFRKSIEARLRWSNLFISIFFPSQELFPLELNVSLSNAAHEEGITDNDVHKLSISRGFSFSSFHEGSENFSSITKSSIVLSSVRTVDSMGEGDKQSFQISYNSNNSNSTAVSNPISSARNV